MFKFLIFASHPSARVFKVTFFPWCTNGLKILTMFEKVLIVLLLEKELLICLLWGFTIFQ